MTSHGHVCQGGRIEVQIGGKQMSVVLEGSYEFLWENLAEYGSQRLKVRIGTSHGNPQPAT